MTYFNSSDKYECQKFFIGLLTKA